MSQANRPSASIFPAIFGGEKPVLTVSEVAALLRASEDSILCHRRELGGFKLGRRVLFRRDRIEKFTEGREPGGGRLEAPRPGPMARAERKAFRTELQARALGKARR